jgi:hypothetical protein
MGRVGFEPSVRIPLLLGFMLISARDYELTFAYLRETVGRLQMLSYSLVYKRRTIIEISYK